LNRNTLQGQHCLLLPVSRDQGISVSRAMKLVTNYACDCEKHLQTWCNIARFTAQQPPLEKLEAPYYKRLRI